MPDPNSPPGPAPRPHQSKAPKRNAAQKAEDEHFVTELRVKGEYLSEIHRLLNEARKGVYTLSLSQVKADLKRVEKAWKLEAMENVDTIKQRELRGLARQERELWEAWEKSKTEKTRQAAERSGAGDQAAAGTAARTKQTVTRETQSGDPAYMRLILEIRDRRAKLLGLNAPDKHEFSGPDGMPIKNENTNVSLTGVIPADVLPDTMVDEMLSRYYASRPKPPE